MPRVRRSGFPPGLFQHLMDRVRDRIIPASQIQLLANWLDSEPTVPPTAWFKRFPGMTVCGDGELVKTFLLPGQIPWGEEQQ